LLVTATSINYLDWEMKIETPPQFFSSDSVTSLKRHHFTSIRICSLIDLAAVSLELDNRKRDKVLSLKSLCHRTSLFRGCTKIEQQRSKP
jgi:hypothetical protein